MGIKYTDEMKEFLKSEVPGKPYKEVLVLFNKKFNTDLKVDTLRSSLKRFRIFNGRTSYFDKGNRPWNKGTKGLTKANSGSFKKGNIPFNLRDVGSERIDSKYGYILIKTSTESGKDNKRWTLKHRYLWEIYNNQKIPKGHIVIFADQNKRNFSKENLILVSRKELLKLNADKLISDNPEITITATNIAKILVKIDELKKRRKNEG